MIERYEDFEIAITKENDQLFADLVAAPGGRRLSRPIPITLPNIHATWVETCQGHKNEAELADLGYLATSCTAYGGWHWRKLNCQTES